MPTVGIEIGTYTTVMSRYDEQKKALDLVLNDFKDKMTTTLACWPLDCDSDER